MLKLIFSKLRNLCVCVTFTYILVPTIVELLPLGSNRVYGHRSSLKLGMLYINILLFLSQLFFLSYT